MPLSSVRARGATVLLAATFSFSASAAGKTAADWQAAARTDLVAIHALILSTHPGSIDESNPGFKDWTEAGYRQALQLVPRVDNYDSMMSVSRFYVTGFLDGHLVYSDHARRDDPILSNGWRTGLQDGRHTVQSVLPDWPVPLPPLGAQLLGCDGRGVEAIMDEDVAPYLDRRPFSNWRKQVGFSMDMPWLADLTLKQCQFRTADGKRLDLPVHYQALPVQRYFSGWQKDETSGRNGNQARHGNRYTLEDGVLWISAANFNPLPEPRQIAEFDAMLAQLPTLQGVRLMVFDARGNGGGSSAIGGRIFDAATGGLDFDTQGMDQLPRTYAQWRVSDLLLATVGKFGSESARRYGPDSKQAKQAGDFLKQVQEAKAKGQPWVEQDGGRLLTRAEIARRNGKLRRYTGPVALVTDGGCASACLDFADLVLSVPGAIHVGRSTSADSLYIDVGRASLPSGNVLIMPQKVWRNRLHGNNEVLVPQIVLKAAMEDDAAVRAETLTALKPWPAATAAAPAAGH